MIFFGRTEGDEQAALRVTIDNRWTAAEMASFFASLDYIYTFEIYISALEDKVGEASRIEVHNNLWLRNLSAVLRGKLRTRTRGFPGALDHQPEIQKVQFASRGEIRFAGLAEAVKEVGNVINRLRFRDLGRAHAAELVRQERMVTLNARLEVMKKLGVSRNQMQQIAREYLKHEEVLHLAVDEGRAKEADVVIASKPLRDNQQEK